MLKVEVKVLAAVCALVGHFNTLQSMATIVMVDHNEDVAPRPPYYLLEPANYQEMLGKRSCTPDEGTLLVSACTQSWREK